MWFPICIGVIEEVWPGGQEVFSCPSIFSPPSVPPASPGIRAASSGRNARSCRGMSGRSGSDSRWRSTPVTFALFNMAVDSKHRGCDLVALRARDVIAAGRVKERASMIQSKTGKPVRFEITETTRRSMDRWIRDPEMIGLEFLWPSRIHGSPHLSARQYARIVRGWVTSVGLEPSAYGTDSMRRTKVAQIYKKTGNLRAVQLLLGHTKMDSTVRYLGIDIEDALTLSEGIDPVASPPDRRRQRSSAHSRNVR